jgi:phage tail-like protein
MDANDSRFHLLLGQSDWTDSLCCLPEQEAAGAPWPPIAQDPSGPLEWRADTAELTLRRQPLHFKQSGATALDPALARRGATADAFGSAYWIDDSRQGLRVRSAGSEGVSAFWPPAPAPAAQAGASFAPASDSAALPSALSTLGGAVVTTAHYLVVGTLSPAGLLIFDLFAGGPPRALLWPAGVAFEPFAMAAGPNGSLTILDRVNRRCWQLDHHFQVVSPTPLTAPPEREDTFQREGSSSKRRHATGPAVQGLDLADPGGVAAQNPVSIAMLNDGTVLILDRMAAPADLAPTGFSAVLVLQAGKLVARLSLQPMQALIAEPDRAGFSLIAHDMVFVPDADSGTDPGSDGLTGRLTVVDASGNQAYAFSLQGRPDRPWALQPLADFLPMRRFGGKGLLVSKGMPHYDFADDWIPLARQPRPRHAPEALLMSRTFDGHQPDCVWHRLLIDACIPPDCQVRVFSRAGDDPALLLQQAWQAEPALYRRGDGTELPHLRSPWPAARSGAAGEGTWELLLQHARGRYAQLKLAIIGNERSTPRLRALRLVYPRFSYLGEYLPAVYREDTGSARFLDGFLANLEGIYTTIEDRIAAAQALLDWRSAPSEALDWLASWLGVALDPAWDEDRRRHFIRHAMLCFQYRGTAHGLRLALSLALDKCVDHNLFVRPEQTQAERFGVRIIEKYRTRKLPDVLFGDPSQTEAPAGMSGKPWQPAEGAAALNQGYAAAVSAPATPWPEFPLVPPEAGINGATAEQATLWTSFCEQALGFTPFAAALERQSWQEALRARHTDVDRLNLAWGTLFAALEDITLPADQPQGVQALDWAGHMRDPAPARTPVERLAWQSYLHSRYATLSALNTAYGSRWQAFDLVPLPDRLPADGPALSDWFQFESAVLAMRRTAHRFSVLLPMPPESIAQPEEAQRKLDLARRIVALEKPAHTVFDVRFYWAMFCIGQARLGLDSLIDTSLRERLITPMVLGRGHLGQATVAHTLSQGRSDRQVLGRDRLAH